MIELKVKKLHPDAIMPRYQTEGAACVDLHAIDSWSVGPQVAHTFSTGLAFEVPSGYALMIYSRSGHGFKNDVRLANCVGVIDSDYRGEVQVRLTNDRDDGYFRVNQGDRIAQAMIVKLPWVDLIEVDALSDTARGTGGMGSTGS